MSAAVGRRLEQEFIVIRGFPGVGKTAVLRELAVLGAATLDLETLASHRGSAFGHLGMATQPTARDFASRIEVSLSAAAGGSLFVEAEGGALGRLAIPRWLRQVIASSDYILLQDTLETRLARIVATYEREPRVDLFAAIATLERRVGKAIADQAHMAVLKDDLSHAAAALLPYYEAAYAHQIACCSGRLIATIDVGEQSPTHIAQEALRFAMAASGLATKAHSCETGSACCASCCLNLIIHRSNRDINRHCQWRHSCSVMPLLPQCSQKFPHRRRGPSFRSHPKTSPWSH